MSRHYRVFVLVLVAAIFVMVPMSSSAQLKHAIGGRTGFAMISSGGASAAAFAIGGFFDANVAPQFYVTPELNLYAGSGTLFEIACLGKYFLKIPRSTVAPYFNGGFGLEFGTGGPYFALLFGGGVAIQVAPKLQIPVDLRLGPVFASGSTVFFFSLTGGVRYTL